MNRPEQPPLPERIGPYVVECELGRGGMGVVYQAHDPRLDRKVAIKVFPRGLADEAHDVSWFVREARLLASINHPNIATIHGIEETLDGSRFVVLERIEGETLASRLRHGRLPPEETLRVAEQVAAALEAAHERGVLHRDLKPGNVMITPRGLVKVLDFGLARPIPPRGMTAEERETTPTDLGLSLGTPGYMSPEHIRGRAQDERTDIFAFGCVVFECLCGRPAFTGETVGDILVHVVTGEVDWSLLPEGTPAAFRALLRRCLEKDVEGRPEGVGEVLEEIRSLRRSIGTGAEAPGYPAEIPDNLPARLTSFVGRAASLAACTRLLDGCRRLTLTGVGGAGKTRLAIRLAASQRERFPDGVWFVDLAPIAEGERLVQAVADACGVLEKRGIPLEATLVAHLETRRTLLLLDNCEHLLGPCDDLVERLVAAAPDLTVLATSRERFGAPGERVFRVPSLDVPATAEPEDLARCESVRLFLDRAAFVQPDFELTSENAAAVGDICRTLDGMPLAIELAAARVQVLSAREIREKLKDRFRLLTRSGRADGSRHRTLRAAIDWSYEQLSEAEADLFRKLSVFSGGWTLEAAVALSGGDEFEVLDLLSELSDKSMVVVEREAKGGTRYRLLETVRRYGLERLEERGEAGASRGCHALYFLDLAERAEAGRRGPEQAGWRRRLEAEHENCLAALAWCNQGEGEPAIGLRLAAHLGWFWLSRAYISLGRSLLAAALQRNPESSAARAKALQRAGGLAQVQADYPAARAAFEEGLAMYRTLGNRRGVARSLHNLARLAAFRGEYGTAAGWFEEALDLRRAIGDGGGEAKTLGKLGVVTLDLGNYDGARRFLEESLRLSRENGDVMGIASALNHLGQVANCLGDYAAAHARSEESLAIKREVGDTITWMGPLVNLALASTRLGDRGTASARLIECLELVWDSGERRLGARALEACAMLAVSIEDDESAARFFGAAGSLREAIGSPMSPAERAFYQDAIAAVRERFGGEPAPAASVGPAASVKKALPAFEAAVGEALEWLAGLTPVEGL